MESRSRVYLIRAGTTQIQLYSFWTRFRLSLVDLQAQFSLVMFVQYCLAQYMDISSFSQAVLQLQLCIGALYLDNIFSLLHFQSCFSVVVLIRQPSSFFCTFKIWTDCQLYIWEHFLQATPSPGFWSSLPSCTGRVLHSVGQFVPFPNAAVQLLLGSLTATWFLLYCQ